ncbi:hypothetical protein [Synechococcus sp. NOUM97013]|uniref:hypothetical protein n=1 Tax=Synechococcus sp. NOUM97013 TaxID=1442555 RepID=UPI0016487416|nr:hypothetical protein [Synechococcus sp. NOUM97013]QNI72343.1 hypothetical protein SynNOUM97013_00251 [Synechococcus sp. NOUM97013]
MSSLFIASRIDHLSTLKKFASHQQNSSSIHANVLLYITRNFDRCSLLNYKTHYSRIIVKPCLEIPTTKNLVRNAQRIAKIVSFSQWLRAIIVGENIQFVFAYPGDLINVLAYNISIEKHAKFIMYEDGLASYQYFSKQSPSRRKISLVCLYYSILKLFIKDLRSSQLNHNKYEKYFFAKGRSIHYHYSYSIDFCYGNTALLSVPIPSTRFPYLSNIASKHFQTVCLYLQPLYKLGFCSRHQLINFYCDVLGRFPSHLPQIILPHPSDDPDFVKSLFTKLGIPLAPIAQKDNTNFYRQEKKCVHISIFSSIMCFNEPDETSVCIFMLSLFCKKFPDSYDFLNSIRLFLFNNGFSDYH